jgi:type II secretory pathway pseudopilin PulG
MTSISPIRITRRPPPPDESSEAGHTLPEALVSILVLSLIIGMATQLLLVSVNGQRTMWSRTQMHSSVRGAIELLQQEVGQAGLVALPGPITFAAASAMGTQTVALNTTAGLFVGQQVTVDTGLLLETVTVTALDAVDHTITGSFRQAHDVGARVAAVGGFAHGIVPPTVANGSSGTLLKLFGDVNSNGQMVYVEYTCSTATGLLSRNMVAWNAASKPALTPGMALLNNVVPNPGGAPCFMYQTEAVMGVTYVTAVAVTLSVRTQVIDPVTGQFQIETKTLLNVSPRNVFHAWQLASMSEYNRIQPTPASILALLP